MGSISKRSMPNSTACLSSTWIARTRPSTSALSSVEELHRLDQAQGLADGDDVADGDERRRSRLRRAVEEADHRRLDPDDLRVHRLVGDADLRDGDAGCAARRRGRDRLVGATNGHAHSLVLDLDLAHAGLLDDLHELADPLRALRVDVAAEQRRLARVALSDRREERLRLVAEHRDEDEVLLG